MKSEQFRENIIWTSHKYKADKPEDVIELETLN